MLAITVIIGGLSIYEVDQYVQAHTAELISVSCLNESTQVNGIFSDMEKSVNIINTYVLDLITSKDDAKDADKQDEIIGKTEEMFSDIAKHTTSTIAYYLRLDPAISSSTAGFFYSKVNGSEDYVCFEPTDLSLYDKEDTEHVGWFWQPYESGKPIWMMPYYNQNNDVLMISYVTPLYYEDLFIGVVGMDFDYNELSDRVHEITIYEHGFAHLEIDGNVMHQGGRASHVETENYNPNDYLRVSEELINGMTLVLSASYDDIRQIRYDIAFEILLIVSLLGLFFSLVVIFMVKKIVDPLKKLTDASQKLAEGNYNVDIVESNTYEIKLLSTAFENMAMNLREHEKMQHMLAYRDSLTGLRNTTSYKVWVTDFNKEIECKTVGDFRVIVLDMNYLKEANDLYGHDTGNKLIVCAAQIISAVFKRSPVFRIGGDEFLVILQNRDLEAADELLEKLNHECAAASVVADNKVIPISIARGVATYNPDTDTSFVDVFNRADDAMYQNKRMMKAANV